MTNATIKHGELNLRKVTGREAVAGDYVVYKNTHNGTPQGEPFKVKLDGDSYDSHTHEFSIDGWGGSVQYDLYEVAPAAKKGDTVKILAMSKYGLNYIGKTGVVDTVNFFDTGYTAVDPTEGGPTGLYLPEQLELIEGEKTMAYTFKEGDKVRVLDGRKGRYNDLPTGAEGVIDNIDFDYEEPYKVYSEEEGDYDRFEAKDIELIVTPAVEFKVGDKVEVMDADMGSFQDQRDGAIGTISHIAEGSEKGIRVTIDGDFDRYPAEALRKVPVATAAKLTFKVGDKVRMISTNPHHGMGEIKTGDIGTLRSVSGKMFTADFPKQSYWNGLASEFELVEDEKAEAPKAELPVGEGDVIRITNLDYIGGAQYITLGKTYEVIAVDCDGDIEITDDDGDEFSILRCEFEGIALVDAEESTEGEFEQFQPGDKVVLLSGGGSFPLSGFHNGGEYEVRNNDFGHSEGRLIQIKKGTQYDNGYALPSQLKKVDAPKFNIGDKAILTSDDGAATMGFRIGEEVTITAGKRGGINDYEIRNTGTVGFASDRHLTAVVPAELKVAKAGDFIEIDFDFVGGNFSLVDITQGKAYKVVTGRMDGLGFIDDTGDYRGAHIKQGAYTVVDAPAVAKVAPAVAVKEYQFVQGDFVRFTDADELDCADYITNGNVYEVIREDSPGFFIEDDGGEEIYIGGYESPYYEKVDAPAPRKLQVGDIVRVDRERGNRAGSRNEEGDIGLIAETNSQSSRVNVSGRAFAGNNEFNGDLTLIVAKENRQD